MLSTDWLEDMRKKEDTDFFVYTFTDLIQPIFLSSFYMFNIVLSSRI